ncbi:hypothetical protein H5397_05160 [Propioniciclava sp. MC1683]|uniref:hypothetical protein n=1 Tax=Propioniciclava sp. MC1683 TaxID=2760309 RepID=UPI0015FF779F|nr:hypothetical protein [Propioniciclava sp. MC1683]MBB1500826.1 hypothetical protein [Propioniciclava sp. MC1683]
MPITTPGREAGPVRLFAASLALGLLATLAPVGTPPTAQAAGIDTTSRQAVTNAYLTRYKPAQALLVPETGTDLSACVAGDEGATSRNANR